MPSVRTLLTSLVGMVSLTATPVFSLPSPLADADLSVSLSDSYNTYDPSTAKRQNGTSAYCPPYAASAYEQEQLFNAYVQLFYIEKNVTEALETYVAEDYIQHNPYLSSGRAPAEAVLPGLLAPATITIIHTVFQSPIGVVHFRVDEDGSPPTAFVDILRYNGSCIQEHWDVIEALPANATNPLALF